MVILEQETYKKYGYYPSELNKHSKKRIVVTCDGCGKIRNIIRGSYRNLCRPCACCGEKNHFFGKEHTQKTKDAISKANTGRSISEERRSKFSDLRKGASNPNWKGGKVKRICPICEKIFYVPQNRIKNGIGKYCGYSCSAKARMHNAKTYMTAPEKTFADICKRNNLPFHFVGDGSLWIGKKGQKQLNPDFIEANGKKVLVEIMGDYWHSPLLNKNMKKYATLEYRKKHYTHYRWIPIFIWESDLKREDAEKFVLSELERYKI